MDNYELISQLYESVGEKCITSSDIAHIEIHGNEVLGVHLVPGFEVNATSTQTGIKAEINVLKNTHILKPVRICFGLMHNTGIQQITMKVNLEENSRVAIMASCTFPNAVEILHTMNATIHIGKNSEYFYFERHVHGPEGGVKVIPKTMVILEENAQFRTDFELLKGSAGNIDLDYEALCYAGSVLEMSARIHARGNDNINIHEKAQLLGEKARGVLTTNIAVSDRAVANIKNTMIASAPYARGHVDCKEIIQGNAIAKAIPIVEVRHPKAHVTHEAAIGRVDSKQLETLMSRGLSEDDATDLIIEGLLSPSY